MANPTLIPIIGSMDEKDLEEEISNELVVTTTSGFQISVPRKGIHAIQAVQPGKGKAHGLYRILVVPQTMLSVNMLADSWAEMDGAIDIKRAALARSGASKRIEDTA